MDEKQQSPDKKAPLSREEKRWRQAEARRAKGTLEAAVNLTSWLRPDLANQPVEMERRAKRWLERLGEDNVKRLSRRLKRMAEWERARAEQMRDAGASSWMLLKFVGAAQDIELDGPECRDTIYAQVLQASVERKRAKGRETLTRVAIPLAVVATVATAVVAGVGYVAPAVASLAGADPSLIEPLWDNWSSWVSPTLEKVAGLIDKEVIFGGTMFALGAFWMWAHDSRITEDLRARAAEKEVPLLTQAIGLEERAGRIQSAIRHIPPAERILLSHFSSTDLRAFLLSNDEERIRMLRENRPPLLAEFKAILASRDRSVSAILPTIRDLANVCLPKKWARAMNMPHPGEIDEAMMQRWRKAAPRVAIDAPLDPAPDSPGETPTGQAAVPSGPRRAGMSPS